MVTENELRLERLKHTGWIGVDLDGTCFVYDKWVGWNVFGAPIPAMINRIRAWRAEGREVKMVTARVGLPIFKNAGEDVYSTMKSSTCRVTRTMFSDVMMIQAIQDLLEKHVGERLPVQCYKDVHMIELWDDRAVQVVPNTGQTLAEAHAAELSALEGRAFNDGVTIGIDAASKVSDRTHQEE
jgi:hypothetical protein